MGKGAFLTITNSREDVICILPPEHVDCMYNNGNEGSDLAPFSRAYGPKKSVTHYIEADAGVIHGCSMSISKFQLPVKLGFDPDVGDEVGRITCSESDVHWWAEATGSIGIHIDPDLLTQDKIVIEIR
jgi:hypothetical protein